MGCKSNKNTIYYVQTLESVLFISLTCSYNEKEHDTYKSKKNASIIEA